MDTCQHTETQQMQMSFFGGGGGGGGIGKQCFIVIKNSSVTLNAQQKDYLLPGLAFAT